MPQSEDDDEDGSWYDMQFGAHSDIARQHFSGNPMYGVWAGGRRQKRKKQPTPWCGDLQSDQPMKRWRHPADKSPYLQLLHRASSVPEGHRDAKLFRRRFRLPFKVFDDLYQRARVSGEKWATTKMEQDGSGRGAYAQPLRNKVLAALRILGRGLDYDTVAWESGISESLIKKFFPPFMLWMATHVFAAEVRLPQGQELKDALHVYQQLGLPGCVCSVDGVHVAWDACPASDRNLHVGKEGYPTKAFNVCVLHTREIIHVAGPVAGATNDLTQAAYDDFLQQLKMGTFGAGVTYKLYLADGSERVVSGLYAICDNGYHHWRCLMPPIKYASSCCWSRHVESVRKDSECTFGVLKKRFRVLRLPMNYRLEGLVGAVFKACCALHNILLRHDGLSTLGHYPSDWKKLSAEQMQAEWLARGARNRAPCTTPATCEAAHEKDSGFDSRRLELIAHFTQHIQRNGLSWPKKRGACRPLPSAPVTRRARDAGVSDGVESDGLAQSDGDVRESDDASGESDGEGVSDSGWVSPASAGHSMDEEAEDCSSR